jgi:hypothetical protein
MMGRLGWIPGNIQKVAVPEGRRGPWSVERFRSKTKRLGWGPSARTFTRLVHADHGVFMSDTPEEMRDHREAARRAHGSCLITGLGLGMILAAALRKPDLTDVTVVEFDADVIALVGPTYDADPRLTIVHADAFTYQPPPGRRYAMVWHDIWDRPSATNLASMATLMRKFAPIADWQGCWAEDQSLRRAGQEAANTPAAAEYLLRYLQSSVQSAPLTSHMISNGARL